MYEICRLIFMLFNWSYFGSMPGNEVASAFFYGLLFDISAIAYINLLFIVLHLIPVKLRDRSSYQLFLTILYFITNSAALLANTVDTEYFKFSGKRTGFEFFKIKSETITMFTAYFKDFWYYFVIWVLMIVGLYFFYRLTRKRKQIILGARNISIQTIYGLIVLIIIIIAGRGGFYLKPIRPFDAARFAEPELMSLITNTPHTMIKTIGDDRLPDYDFLPEQELKMLYNPLHISSRHGENMKRVNVMIIILESIGREYIGYYHGGKGYTPFLDSLLGQSLVFKNSFANGKRSIDALPAILSSIPSWMGIPYVNTSYQSNNISSLGKMLAKEGYYTAFFHGGRNGTMAFDSYINVSSFGKYYGMNEYPRKDDFDGGWGIADEPFEQFMIEEINRNNKPFCVALFTLSSHHPYHIPDKHKSKFKDGSLPIHKAVRYSDYALKQFFETASRMPWYNNTLFVITADHTAESITSYYQTMIGKYAVPVVFYKPGQKLVADTNRVVQQIDIMPSILDYLNYPNKYFAFGNSVFDTTSPGWAVQFNDNLWQILKYPDFFVFNANNAIGFYNFENDKFLKQNLIHKVKPESYLTIENELKAIIQSYSRALNRNEMIGK
jgi:phosphoglycerol transferase MdoB-like AlkP superfamily enzyme